MSISTFQFGKAESYCIVYYNTVAPILVLVNIHCSGISNSISEKSVKMSESYTVSVWLGSEVIDKMIKSAYDELVKCLTSLLELVRHL